MSDISYDGGPPDYDLIVSRGEWSSQVPDVLFQAASGLLIGDNPAYAISDFLAFYPQFGTISDDSTPVYTGLVPQAVLAAFIALASASLSFARWCESWQLGMALFIAHYCTLYLQASQPSGATAAQVASAGLAMGVTVSKSVGPVSKSVQIPEGFQGAFALTSFGQQLLTIARIVGMGTLWVA